MSKKQSIISGDFRSFKKAFDDLFPTIKQWLTDHGYTIPTDAFDMFTLFIKRYYNEGETSGKIEYRLTREDFVKFHEMVESDMRMTGEVNRRIRLFADGGKEKNREICMLVLLGFESDINILKSVEKTSVILKHVRREGYLKNVEEVSEKSICNWIDSYRTQYYPQWEKK